MILDYCTRSMASASALILLLFIAVLVPSTSQEKDNNGQFDEWISLNMKHYNSRKSLKWMQESIKQKKQEVPPAPSSSSLDPRLIYAEMNKIIISVSQDGSGNFNTIKEALASIPLYNKRRVILDIKPGVYRYVPLLLLCVKNIYTLKIGATLCYRSQYN